MIRTTTLALAALAAALVLPAAAAGKGASKASLQGPHVKGTLVIPGDGESEGTPLGDVYGYQVRFDRKASARTRVLVVTPGILLRVIQDNPFLEGIAAVVFDEFHERGLESDLALGMVRLVRQTVRPDLLCVVMSATTTSSRGKPRPSAHRVAWLV